MTPSPIPQTDPRAGYLAQRDAIDAAIARVLDRRLVYPRQRGRGFRGGVRRLARRRARRSASATAPTRSSWRCAPAGSAPATSSFTVSHTAVATVAAIERAGASPVLVDIEPGDLHDGSRASSARRCSAAARAGRAAVMPVHLYGQPADLARSPRARPAPWPAADRGLRAEPRRALSTAGRPAAFGDLACFSFYPTKNLGALGDGGMVVDQRSGARRGGCARSANMAGASAMSATAPASTRGSTRSRRRSSA